MWAPPILLVLGLGLLPRPMTFRFRGRPPAVVKRRVRKVLLISSALVVIGFTALVVIWGLHGFRYGAGTTSGYAYARPWKEVLPEGPVARAAVLWAQDAKLLPEAYLHGLSVALRKVKRSAFLMGEISADGWTLLPGHVSLKDSAPVPVPPGAGRFDRAGDMEEERD